MDQKRFQQPLNDSFDRILHENSRFEGELRSIEMDENIDRIASLVVSTIKVLLLTFAVVYLVN